MSRNAAVRQIVEKHGAEDLLPMLGLVDEDGSTPPDDDNVYALFDPSRGPGAKNPDTKTGTTREPENLTSPEGLRNPPPGANPEAPPKKRRGPKPQPKVIKPRVPREVPECGTYKAYSRHRRQGLTIDQMDEACQEACREYGRTHGTEYRSNRRVEREMKRLLAEGVNPESAAMLAEKVR